MYSTRWDRSNEKYNKQGIFGVQPTPGSQIQTWAGAALMPWEQRNNWTSQSGYEAKKEASQTREMSKPAV